MKAAEATTKSRRRHIPVRTCAGCRQRESKRELFRIARTRSGAVVIDRRQRAPGRGAYVHPVTSCVERATRRGGVARHLRASISPEVAATLREQLQAELLERGESRSSASAVGSAHLEEGQS